MKNSKQKAPIAEVIDEALSGFAKSEKPLRIPSIGLFLTYLERNSGDWDFFQEKPKLRETWMPFAENVARSKWQFKPPVAVLRWVTPSIISGFMAWRDSSGDASFQVANHVYTIYLLLAKAAIYDVFLDEQKAALDIPQSDKYLSGTQVKHLIASLPDEKSLQSLMNSLIIHIALYTGLRYNEILGLKTSQIIWEGMQPIGLKLEREKPISIMLHPAVSEILLRWLRQFHASRPPSSPEIFVIPLKREELKKSVPYHVVARNLRRFIGANPSALAGAFVHNTLKNNTIPYLDTLALIGKSERRLSTLLGIPIPPVEEVTIPSTFNY